MPPSGPARTACAAAAGPPRGRRARAPAASPGRRRASAPDRRAAAAAAATFGAFMLSVAACLVLGLVLLASAVLKLADRQGTQSALATYGIRSGVSLVWGALVAVEAGLGVAVAAGIDAAAYAAAGLMVV